MSHKREIIKGFLIDLVAFPLIFLGFVFAYQSTIGDMPLIYLLMAVPFFLLSFLRVVLGKRHGLNILIHIAVLVGTVFLPFDLELRVLIGLFMFATFIYSLAAKLRDQWSPSLRTAAFSVFYCLALFVLLNIFDNGSAAVFALINLSALLIIVASILYVHAENFDFNLMVHSSLYKRYDGKIIAANNKLAILMAAALAVVGVISVISPMGRVLAATVAGAYRVVAWVILGIWYVLVRILAFFFQNIEYTGPPRDPEPPTYDLTFDFGDIEGFDGTRSQASENIIIVLIVVAILAVIIMLITAVYNSNKDKYREAKTNDYSVSKVKFSLGDLSSLIPRFRNFVKHPVRRAYIKKVKSHMKRGVMVEAHDTPDMIAGKILEKEDIGELTGKYERVRYGKG